MDAKAKALHDAFHTFDTDDSGSLTAAEVAGILCRPGCAAPMTEEEARAFVHEFDTNGDGVLCYDEFIAAMQASQASVDTPAPSFDGSDPSGFDLRGAFHAFDADGSGTIDAQEFLAILTRSDPNGESQLSEADAKELIASFDVNGDGHFNIQEYLNAMIMGGLGGHCSSLDSNTLADKSKALKVSLGLEEDVSHAAVVEAAAEQLGLDFADKPLNEQIDQAYAFLFDD